MKYSQAEIKGHGKISEVPSPFGGGRVEWIGPFRGVFWFANLRKKSMVSFEKGEELYGRKIRKKVKRTIYLTIFWGFSRALVVFTSSPMLMRTPSPHLGEYIASVGLLPPTVSLVGYTNNPHFVWDFRSTCVPTTGSAHWGKLTIQLDPARMVVLAKVKLGPRKFVVGMLVVLRLRNLTNRYQQWWALENVSPSKRWLF